VKEFTSFLGDLAIYISPIVAIIYLISFIRNDKIYKVFTIYLIAMALVQISSHYVGRGGLNKTNLYFSHIFYISQFIILSIFYLKLLSKKIIVYLLLIVLLLISIQFINDPSIFFRYNPIGMSFTQIILVVYSIIYLYKSLTNKGEFVIVNIGILIYLLSSTLIFASGNLVLDLNISKETRLVLVNVNRMLSIIFQILVFIEWYRNYRIRVSRN